MKHPAIRLTIESPAGVLVQMNSTDLYYMSRFGNTSMEPYEIYPGPLGTGMVDSARVRVAVEPVELHWSPFYDRGLLWRARRRWRRRQGITGVPR